ncbi:hypothetical protein IJ425_05355 [bacterium]|nr:hypothetical protein [bacterium]
MYINLIKSITTNNNAAANQQEEIKETAQQSTIFSTNMSATTEATPVKSSEIPERWLNALDEYRTDEFGPKFEDLSKEDRNHIKESIKEAEEDGSYDNPENIIESDIPGVYYQQVGDFIETTLTLYDGLSFQELPEEDQKEIVDWEENVKDIENSSLSDKEKERALNALDVPDCMNDMTVEKRYTKGKMSGNTPNNEEQQESNIEYKEARKEIEESETNLHEGPSGKYLIY